MESGALPTPQATHHHADSEHFALAKEILEDALKRSPTLD